MSTTLFDLTGKTAFITGSSRGIGLALAKGLCQAGASVVLNGRNAKTVNEARDSLRNQYSMPAAQVADVTDPGAVKTMFDAIEAETGPVDILINNAGMQHRAPLEDFPTETFDALMRMNVNAAFYVGQRAAKSMIANGGGRIINICSLMSFHARYSIAPYTASKGAIAMLTKGMATDWARHNINVNGIAPGYFDTELNQALVQDQEFSDWLVKRTPKGRWGQVDELVGTAIYLASEASSFVTGQIITVDGGLSATI